MEKRKFYQDVDGIRMPAKFSKDVIRSAMNYKATPGDLFIVTYPKCGTTWMHQIVLLILRKGRVFLDPYDFILSCPFIETVGREYIETAKPKVMKTHFPFCVTPFSVQAKYIYVARNPKDCCVSFYHFIKFITSDNELSFDDFFDRFIDGEVGVGDYFEHLYEWHKHRNDKNVYFVTYEKLRKNITEEIFKIAKFMGEEYEKSIVEDPKIMENIVYYSSFEYMKEHVDIIMINFFKGHQIFHNENLPSGLVKTMKILSQPGDEETQSSFIRKGVVNEWSHYFNENQLKRLQDKINNKFGGTDIMNLWVNIQKLHNGIVTMSK
ncbi:sulfotransferase 1B1-like [Centruroides vittatus]|uniref:sulfotransferase 1B1-like n=1 Tax=Centruroides vittatus TaxID=120091 RepID=UPI00350EEE43